jgi:hypothetical protein
MRAGSVVLRSDADKLVHIRQFFLYENVIEVKLLPAVACSDAGIVSVHPALIPRNKLALVAILVVTPTLGHPATVAVKFGFKDVGRRYPEYRFETRHLHFYLCDFVGAAI